MPGGTLHDGASGADTSIGNTVRSTPVAQPEGTVRATPRPQPDGHPAPGVDGRVAPPADSVPVPVSDVVAEPVPRTDALGRPLAGDGIDPAERTPRSFHLSRSLLERARAAAYWLAQLPDRREPTNVSELVERALSYEVERLERAYNNGTPFPAVMGRMRTGPGASGVERIRRAQRARRRHDPATGPTDPTPGDELLR